MTSIEWTDKTWNPVRGCSPVSPGCKHCYAETFGGRFCGPGLPYEGLVELRVPKAGSKKRAHWTGKTRFVEEHLADPLRWTRPRRVFVNSMSDLFHESLPFEQIASVFGVMASSPQHTFQMLTKRPERMREWFRWVETKVLDGGDAEVRTCIGAADRLIERHWDVTYPSWPLPNVWIGVSVENQATADARITILLDTPAAVRWVSYEPALGPVDFAKWLDPWTCSGCGFHGSVDDSSASRCSECNEDAVYDEVLGSARCPKCGANDGQSDSVGLTCPRCGGVESWSRDCGHKFENDRASGNAGLDWIVVGGESGPRARPFDLAWARRVVEQCRTYGVPVFVKQLGALPESGNCEDLWGRRALGPRRVYLRHRKGADMAEWPEDLRVREFPEVNRG